MIQEIKLSDSEYRLMEIIWQAEPVASMELVRLANEALDWKKSTTYTMLKRLVEKGAAQNKDAKVSSLVKKEAVAEMESKALLEKTFGGSVTDFFAAFLQDRKLTKEEAAKIARMIEEATK